MSNNVLVKKGCDAFTFIPKEWDSVPVQFHITDDGKDDDLSWPEIVAGYAGDQLDLLDSREPFVFYVESTEWMNNDTVCLVKGTIVASKSSVDWYKCQNQYLFRDDPLFA